jgi:hypothetical protein
MLNLKSIDVKSISDIPNETLRQCLDDTGLIVENLVRLTEAARKLVAEKNQSLWNEQFEQLLEFEVEFGHFLVPARYSANPKLGYWVSTQRCKYRLYQDGKPSPMTDECIRQLESIGFDWGTSQTDCTPSWSVQLPQLCKFKEEFGHCTVPAKYPANPKLGQWVSKQHYYGNLYQEGKPSTMPANRIQELESIGFDWGTSKTDCASI